MYDFKVLILEGAFSSSVAITHDILATAEVLAKRLQGGMIIDTVKLPINTTDDSSV